MGSANRSRWVNATLLLLAHSIVIFQDLVGRSERLRSLCHAHPQVVPVTPETHTHPGAETIPLRHDWLPREGELLRKCWWKADAMALAAAEHLQIEADFYWFVESDVAASPERWRAVFADHEDNRADCVHLTMGRRDGRSTFRHWNHPATPPTADRFFIMAVYRLSRMALEMSIARAAELRECFSEVAVPLVIRDAHMSFSPLNRTQRHFTDRTVRSRPEDIHIDKKLLCHPLKSNTLGP